MEKADHPENISLFNKQGNSQASYSTLKPRAEKNSTINLKLEAKEIFMDDHRALIKDDVGKSGSTTEECNVRTTAVDQVHNILGGIIYCQNGCRSTGFDVIYHPTCDTSVQNDHQQTTESAESKRSLTVTMPSPHNHTPTSLTTVVS
ncbi:hypothetical protein LAZ67_17000029 [Cordylochernes scorpioides]|uniref:Uncharacterized protein n=1 Tax=Cordylochernes scorpioides TaxID=51811 RepID=A0ABY6LGN4_9ARAC|nr:hypothetical protein LAZ67_17000029 [Cordylochernes scorpioides]